MGWPFIDCIVEQTAHRHTEFAVFLTLPRLAHHARPMFTFGFDRYFLLGESMRCGELRMAGRTVSFIFTLDLEAGSNARRFDKQFVPSSVKLILVFESLDQALIETRGVVDDPQIVSKGEIGLHRTRQVRKIDTLFSLLVLIGMGQCLVP